MKHLFKKLSTAQIIALGFLSVILIGSVLLILPFSVKEGVEIKYIDALYTSTSAVCVTGLVSIDPGTAFTPLGQFFLAVLIQIGGLGVTAVGAGIILAIGKKIDLKGRNLIIEASNLSDGKGTIRFLKNVLLTTFVIELVGAALGFIVFIQDYSLPTAIGYSLFHSVAAFNNSGFDILGHSGSLYSNNNLFVYHDNILLNVITTGLIILGGIGFLVIREICKNLFCWKKYSMHSKVVIIMTAILIIAGTLLLKLTESEETWLGAYFHSVSTRTAGFSTTNMGTYSEAGILIMCALMFIGASPGSTGGGIKTSTFFVLLMGIKSAATNKSEQVFKYSIPKDAFRKAAIIAMIGLILVIVSTSLLLIFEPSIHMSDALFEMVSAFGTVGLSTGITSGLGIPAKLLSILMMYIGRMGPITIITLWHFTNGNRTHYPEGNIAIG